MLRHDDLEASVPSSFLGQIGSVALVSARAATSGARPDARPPDDHRVHLRPGVDTGQPAQGLDPGRHRRPKLGQLHSADNLVTDDLEPSGRIHQGEQRPRVRICTSGCPDGLVS